VAWSGQARGFQDFLSRHQIALGTLQGHRGTFTQPKDIRMLALQTARAGGCSLPPYPQLWYITLDLERKRLPEPVLLPMETSPHVQLPLFSTPHTPPFHTPSLLSLIQPHVPKIPTCCRSSGETESFSPWTWINSTTNLWNRGPTHTC
jgi:hypothetical protein